MASNFHITLHRKMDNVRLRLRGDFDGMSAMMLICAIKDNYTSAQKIYIETDGLSTLLPFGQDVFKKKLSLSKDCLNKLVFIGDHGQLIAPEGVNSVN